MQNELVTTQLKVEPASEKDWLEILQLLEENDLIFWFTGNESSKNFYIAKDPENKKSFVALQLNLKIQLGF